MKRFDFIKASVLVCTFLGWAYSVDASKTAWGHVTDLSGVTTRGNTESESYSIQHKSGFEKGSLRFQVQLEHLLVAASEQIAVQNLPDTTSPVVQNRDLETGNSEFYNVRLNVAKSLADKWFGDVLLHWDRNESKGVRNRYEGGVGMGYVVSNSQAFQLRTDIHVLFTSRESFVDASEYDDDFLGLATGYELKWVVTEKAVLTQELEFSTNADQTSDFKGSLKTGLAVPFSKRFALKVYLNFAYENEPALKAMPLFLGSSEGPRIGDFEIELDSLDSNFNVALSINF